MRSLLHSLVSRSFLVVWSTHVLFSFLSSPFVWWYAPPIFLSTCNFPFLQAFGFFLDSAVLFLPLFIFYLFSLWARRICLCQIQFLYPCCFIVIIICKFFLQVLSCGFSLKFNWNIQVFVYLSFCFLLFSLHAPLERQNAQTDKFFSSSRFGLLARIGWSACLSKFLGK